ncbi:hypothetical protein L6164_034088 [Bauhinia variegata]|uniref:Uncharacterized protein n=1 Tax=Bauhinia variegata TaxID=167791 RepID=A0ACB9KUK3_BAUVA|nr:hypothetical protein L6164_034088 [Bauhinia variegata]
MKDTTEAPTKDPTADKLAAAPLAGPGAAAGDAAPGASVAASAALMEAAATRTTHATFFISMQQTTRSVKMAHLSFSAARILMAAMAVALFCVTKTVAQDPDIAPTPPLEAGAGFALHVSGVALLVSSLVSFMLQ